MALIEGPPPPIRRRRGRPVGSDSAETRGQILKASREVINQRGYQAATFQSIAVVAGLSRPTLHYYFAAREDIYRALVAEVDVVVADCIAAALHEDTLAEQLSAFIAAIHEADHRDRSQIAFLITARLESARNPELRSYACSDIRDFLATAIDDAVLRGELAADTAVAPVVDMLHAVLWGVGFYAGFVDDSSNMRPMTRHLDQLFSHGLLGIAEMTPPPRDTFHDTPSAVGGRP
jgi:AcrR family transcriptional regulator